ncbi:MAG: phosphoglycerate kinase, partial [Armatimonadetes bacterium]|nr:phosphoglycerate kinase [Armatimonadota bacterium]
MTKRTVQYLADSGLIDGKQVLMRVDFNVPMENGAISDDTRVRAALPTIKFLLRRGARLVLCSHLERPQSVPASQWHTISLAPVAGCLSAHLGTTVQFAGNCVGDLARQARAALRRRQVLLLENTRFHSGEEMNCPLFATALAGLKDGVASKTKKLDCPAEVFVNDAFGACHRAHASTAGVVGAMAGSPHVMGFLVERELQVLQEILDRPGRLVVVLGGAKVSDKIGVVRNLLPIAKTILIGGGMAYTFLAAEGHPIGKSLFEPECVETVRQVRAEARAGGVEIVLPTDVVVAPAFKADARATVVPACAIPPGQEGMDIGPETRQRFAEEVADADTVFWNGPMGVFE